MKGLMATMLVLCLMGIVSGQQFQQDSFSTFGVSNPARPSPDSNPGSFPTREQTGGIGSSAEPSQLLMTLDAEIVGKFRSMGELSSGIDPQIRHEIGEVVFGYPGPIAIAKNPNQTSQFLRIQPLGRENNALIFEFSEIDLKMVETGTLRYRFAADEIGRYDAIVVRLRNIAPQNVNRELDVKLPDSPSIGSSDRLAQNPTSFRDINPPNDTSRSNESFLDSRLLDRGTGNLGREQPTSELNRFASNNPSTSIDTTGLGTFQPRRMPDTNLWQTETPIDRRPDSNLDQDEKALIQSRAAHLARVNEDLNGRESELARQERLLAEKQRLFLDELEQVRRSGGIPTRGDLSAPYLPTSTSNATIDNRITNAGLNPLDTRFSSDQLARNPDLERDSQLQKALNRIADRIEDLKHENAVLGNRFDSFVNQNSTGQQVAQLDATSPQIPLRSNDRISRTYTPSPSNQSLSNFKTQISGPNGIRENQVNNQNMSGPLFFMLCCSLGLNIYLGLISRNFYVRYNELADELRETFSASVSS